MTLPELIDNLIAASCEDMPEEARQSLDDAIDHIVSSMNDEQLNNLFQMGLKQMEKELMRLLRPWLKESGSQIIQTV